eukprot:Nitzschia sp. Nitz4//scaffold28_size193895//133320//134033//NITZ4_001673-RA/size193895-processed-gene-0.232-mRNA-1//1//CDS//3329546006//435//frame0
MATPKSNNNGYYAAHVLSLLGMAVVVHAALTTDDVSDALAFYGVYHREPRNQMVHFVGVPAILWSGIIFLVHLPVPYLGDALKQTLPADYQLTYGLCLTLFYLAFYLNIDSFGGTTYAPMLYLMYMSAVYMRRYDQKAAKPASWSGTGRLMAFAAFVHFLGWFLQVAVGHKIYEGSQPALLQSLGGALTVAPLFAWYEGLWYVGINKELQNMTLQLVDKYTAELCEAGSTMRVCSGM